MRVSPPLLRTELVVSREAMRIVPVVARRELRAVERRAVATPEDGGEEEAAPAEKECNGAAASKQETSKTNGRSPEARIDDLQAKVTELEENLQRLVNLLERKLDGATPAPDSTEAP